MPRYSSEQLRRMSAEGKSRTDHARLAAMTEAEVEAAAIADNAEHGVADDWYLRARFVPAKQPISIRLDADLLEFFRAQGPGWQTRINAVLRAYKDAVEKAR